MCPCHMVSVHVHSANMARCLRWLHANSLEALIGGSHSLFSVSLQGLLCNIGRVCFCFFEKVCNSVSAAATYLKCLAFLQADKKTVFLCRVYTFLFEYVGV